jgi:hypothetical protein
MAEPTGARTRLEFAPARAAFRLLRVLRAPSHDARARMEQYFALVLSGEHTVLNEFAVGCRA